MKVKISNKEINGLIEELKRLEKFAIDRAKESDPDEFLESYFPYTVDETVEILKQLKN